MRFGSSYSPSTTPPLHSTQTHTPLCLRDTSPCLTPPLPPLMEITPIPAGNRGLAAAISCANTPHLQEPPSPSPSAEPSPPLAFLAEIFTQTTNSLQLNPDLVQDLSPHGLQIFTAGEGCIVSIVCATVSGIVAITTKLRSVNTQLAEMCKENQELRSNLYDHSSKITNKSGTHEDIRPLKSALCDLSHRVTTVIITDRPTAPTSHTTAPTAPHNASPRQVSPPPLPSQ